MDWKNKDGISTISVDLSQHNDFCRREVFESFLVQIEIDLAQRTCKGTYVNCYIVGKKLLKEFRKTRHWTNTMEVKDFSQGIIDVINKDGKECDGYYMNSAIYYSNDLPDNIGYAIGNGPVQVHGPGIIRMVLEGE